MTSDYDDRREKIEHRRIAQGQKDLARKCHCGLVRAHHTAVQANACRKTEGKHTMGRIMTDRDIQKARLSKV